MDAILSLQDMAQTAGLGRKYLKAFVSGFFVAVPVTVTVLDRLAYVARVEGASMQVSYRATFSVGRSILHSIVRQHVLEMCVVDVFFKN